MNAKEIAKVCHEANRAYCATQGDNSQKRWEETDLPIKDSVIAGVVYKLKNPNITPEDQHEAWSKFKSEQGYVYGATKSDRLKTHPCLVPYFELPEFQKTKDILFQSIINALKGE